MTDVNKDELLQQILTQLRLISQQLIEVMQATPRQEHVQTKVVLAIGDELYGRAIAQFAVHHNWQGKPKFYLLHAVEPLPSSFTAVPVPTEDLQSIFDQLDAFGNRLLTKVEAVIMSGLPDAEIEKIVRTGNPKDEILQLAKDVNAQFIIMGSHGRTGFKRFALGSVSMSVVSHAPCSVVIVRVSDQERESFEKAQVAFVESDLPEMMRGFVPMRVESAQSTKG